MRHSRQNKQQKALSNQMRASCRQLRNAFEALGMMVRQTRGTHDGHASGEATLFNQDQNAAQAAVQTLTEQGFRGVSFAPHMVGVRVVSQDGWDVTVRGF